MKTLRSLSSKIKIIILFCFSLIAGDVYSQLDGFPLHQQYIEQARTYYSHIDSSKHTASLPFNVQNVEENFFITDTSRYFSVGVEKLLRSDFISIEEEDFKVNINPLFNVTKGWDLIDTTEYSDTTNFIRNTRGIKVDGQIGKRFFFHTSFFENQATLPLWQKDIADQLLVVPSSGRHKRFNTDGFDFGFSQGWLSYYPIKNLNIYFGHGKQFVGHGYRSHLLSHQSFNYPHLKYTLTLLQGKLQVNWSFAALQTLERQPLGEVPESLFKRKGGSFAYLNYLLGKRIQIGVFEGNIWRRFSNTTGSQRLAWNAYVPLPFFGIATQNDTNEGSTRIGFNTQVKLTNKISVHGQYLPNGNGIQAGINITEALLKGLQVRAEYNSSSGETVQNSLIDFKHFNEELGHPLASSEFEEILAIINYRKNRWSVNLTSSVITGEKERTTIDAGLNYLVNPSTNTNIILGYLSRSQTDTHNSGFLYFGLSSNVYDAFFNF